MSVFLYNCAIYLMLWGLKLVAPFHKKARAMVNGRKNWRQSLSKLTADGTQPIIWFHCASLGEFEQGRPVIEAIRKSLSHYKLLLTFYSPSGYEVRKNYDQVDLVTYLPLDTPKNAREFIELVQPQWGIIIKYEYWYNLLSQAHLKGTRLLLCSALFRADQIFFKPWGQLHRKMLGYFEQMFVQDANSVQLLKSIGCTNMSVTGDTRIDRVSQVKQTAQPDQLVARFVQTDKPVVVVGSSWPADIEVLQQVVQQTDWKFVVAPHEINPHHLQHLQKTLPVKTCNYTVGDLDPDARILVIDTVGKLAQLYQYADLAYIGGALGQGLHNTLEAATFGVPLFFGNRNYKKFAEAVYLIEHQAAWAIGDGTELYQTMMEIMNDTHKREHAKQVSLNFIQEHAGATQKILNYMIENR